MINKNLRELFRLFERGKSRRRWRGDRSILVNNRGVARAEIIHLMNYLARLKIRFHAPRLGAPNLYPSLELVNLPSTYDTALCASLVENKKRNSIFEYLFLASAREESLGLND